MIISNETQEALMELIKQCFIENRKFDRMVSVLGVEFACNNAASYIHQGIAHYFPQLSDKIGELCLERYNISVVYGDTPRGDERFSSVTEIIKAMENRIIAFQAMFMGVCKIALDNDDINVYSDLLPLLSNYNEIVEQSILLSDKLGYYSENNIMLFDSDIEHFWILG